MSAERIDRLEERLAWLERHIEEQDKVMLEQAEAIDRLRAELRLLRDRAASGSDEASRLPPPAADRPPHY